VRYSTVLVLAASLLFPAVAPAQIYECINARGAREFAQVCSPGTVRQREVMRGDEVPAAVPEPKSSAQQDAEFRKRLQERQDAEAKVAADRAKADEVERNCTMARAQLKGLLEGQRIQRLEPDTGARINLGDDERALETERQRTQVEQWCK
jgi:hypothetical protein